MEWRSAHCSNALLKVQKVKIPIGVGWQFQSRCELLKLQISGAVHFCGRSVGRSPSFVGRASSKVVCYVYYLGCDTTMYSTSTSP